MRPLGVLVLPLLALAGCERPPYQRFLPFSSSGEIPMTGMALDTKTGQACLTVRLPKPDPAEFRPYCVDLAKEK